MHKLVSHAAGIDEHVVKLSGEKAGHGSLVIEELWPRNKDQAPQLTVSDALRLYEVGPLQDALGGMTGKEVAWMWRLVDRRLFTRAGARVVLNALHPEAYKGALVLLVAVHCLITLPATSKRNPFVCSLQARGLSV